MYALLPLTQFRLYIWMNESVYAAAEDWRLETESFVTASSSMMSVGTLNG